MRLPLPTIEHFPGVKEASLLRDLYQCDRLPYHARMLTDKTRILAAQRLLGQVYVDKGILDPSCLDEFGRVDESLDPYRNHATYFDVCDRTPEFSTYPLIAGRLISPTPEEGFNSFQLRWEDLPDDVREDIFRQNPKHFKEFASLVKRPGVPQITSLYLFRKMIRYSIDEDVKFWIFGLHSNLAAGYKKRFGAAIIQIGKTVRLASFNAQYVPFILDVKGVYSRFSEEHVPLRRSLGHKALGRFMIAEIPELKQLPPTPLDQLGLPRIGGSIQDDAR